MDIPVKALSDIEVKSEVSENDKILILDSETEEARLASKDELKGEQWDPWEQWEPWEPWQDGVAATITIGSTQTLPAGSSATVTNTGSSSEAVLDFGIPTWPKGAPWQDWNDGRGIYSITSSKSWKTTTITIAYTDESTPSTFQVEDWADGQWSWDVVWPSSSTSWHLAVFDWLTGKIIKDGGAIPNGVIVASTAPSPATEGMVWYDTANDILKSYDGTNWNILANWDILYSQFAKVTATSWATLTISDLTTEFSPTVDFTIGAWTVKEWMQYVVRINSWATACTMTLWTWITNPFGEDLTLTASKMTTVVLFATSSSALEIFSARTAS